MHGQTRPYAAQLETHRSVSAHPEGPLAATLRFSSSATGHSLGFVHGGKKDVPLPLSMFIIVISGLFSVICSVLCVWWFCWLLFQNTTCILSCDFERSRGFKVSRNTNDWPVGWRFLPHTVNSLLYTYEWNRLCFKTTWGREKGRNGAGLATCNLRRLEEHERLQGAAVSFFRSFAHFKSPL